MQACTTSGEPGAALSLTRAAADASLGRAGGLGAGEVTTGAVTVGDDSDMREDSLEMMCVQVEEEELSRAEIKVALAVEDALSALFAVLRGAALAPVACLMRCLRELCFVGAVVKA